ncbi:hypothetical protein Gotri_021996, partial [Gossypium trilobum]|nr:hypothetical protein [Gossypium trilobum]
DDCVSIRDGSKILVINGVTCGPGHGISIVSLELFKNEEPVDGVTIKNCTMTNTSNGVRIKSWPSVETGTCSNIHFEDIIMTNVSSPIIIDQKYCPWSKYKINEESKFKLSNISFKKFTTLLCFQKLSILFAVLLCIVKMWNLLTLKLCTVDRLDL